MKLSQLHAEEIPEIICHILHHELKQNVRYDYLKCTCETCDEYLYRFVFSDQSYFDITLTDAQKQFETIDNFTSHIFTLAKQKKDA